MVQCESVWVWKSERTSCVQSPAACSCKTGKYLGSIIDNPVFTCDEIIEETGTIPTKIVLTKSARTIFYI